ncbi:MAG: hypothetical protein WB491_12065 [Candidatus Aquilonibacter sp.]
MTEKAFRLDFFIAIAALLISALTAGALVYQTRVIADQYAATIWPYLAVNGTLSPNGGALDLDNDGLGPALIESAQLVVDGKNVAGWDSYLHALLKDKETLAYFTQLQTNLLLGKPFSGSVSTDSVGPGTTIRPGDSLTLMKMDLPGAPVATMKRHSIGLKLCYCSLNKSCWTLDTSVKKPSEETQPVAACTMDASIAAAAFRSLSARPRKR